MSSWRGAWYIFRNEMRQSWIGVVITLLFFTYIGMIMIPLVNEMLADAEGEKKLSWMSDLLYLMIVPFMSFLMNSSIFRYRREDPYTRRIAYLRTMPISLNAIVIARMLQQVAILIPMAIFFYTLQYLAAGELNEMLSVGQYMYFVFFWMGYSIIIGCSYVYIEQAYNGRIYFAVSIATMLLYGGVAAILWAGETDLVLRSIQAAANRELVWPILMNVLAAGVLILTGVLIRRRLAARDFTH